MHCPECLVEYREGFTLCADCRVPLKPGPPPEPSKEPQIEMVAVLECQDSVATALAKASLTEAGIPFSIEGQDEVAVRMESFSPLMHSWCRFLVPRESEEEARAVLEPLEQAVPGPIPDPDVDLVPVQECGEPMALALAKATLEEAGIPFCVQSDEVEVRNACVPLTHARYRILVAGDYAGEARELLSGLGLS